MTALANATADVIAERSERRPEPASPLVRDLGLSAYETVWREMQAFTAARNSDTADEIWLLQSTPVYTLGVAARPEHLPVASPIPQLKVDRGGQVTYHGPGQLIAFLLLDLRRLGIGVRPLVRRMENAVIDLLEEFGIAAAGRPAMPGVYVDDAKIAALGLRVRNGCCYHGLALNVDLDLTPFAAIDPCGYPGLAVTQMRDLGVGAGIAELGPRLAQHLTRQIAARST
jgi:lipoyl(octanoyl) transferase